VQRVWGGQILGSRRRELERRLRGMAAPHFFSGVTSPKVRMLRIIASRWRELERRVRGPGAPQSQILATLLVVLLVQSYKY
jgi:hypothetical protein